MDIPAPAMPDLPEITSPDLAGLREAASTCTRCPLHGPATQTVFGEGATTR